MGRERHDPGQRVPRLVRQRPAQDQQRRPLRDRRGQRLLQPDGLRRAHGHQQRHRRARAGQPLLQRLRRKRPRQRERHRLLHRHEGLQRRQRRTDRRRADHGPAQRLPELGGLERLELRPRGRGRHGLLRGPGDSRREQPHDRQRRERHARGLRSQGRQRHHVSREHGRRRPAVSGLRVPRQPGGGQPGQRGRGSAQQHLVGSDRDHGSGGGRRHQRVLRRLPGGSHGPGTGQQPLLERRRGDSSRRPRQPAVRRLPENGGRSAPSGRPVGNRSAALDGDRVRERQRDDPAGVRAARRALRDDLRVQPGGGRGRPGLRAGRRHPGTAARERPRPRRLRGGSRGHGDRAVLRATRPEGPASRSPARILRPAPL